MPPTWVGEHQWPGEDRGIVVTTGNNTPHKLPGTTGNLPGSQNLCKGLEPLCYSLQIRQCHSCDLPESEGGSPLGTPVQPCSGDLGLVSGSQNHSDSGASAGVRQSDSRSGVTISAGSVRLDAESFSVPSYPTTTRTFGARPVCVSTHNSPTSVLQLAPRSRSGGNRCLHSGLGSEQGVCQPTMVLNQPLFTPSVSTAGKDCDGNALVEHSGLVSSNPGYVGGLPQTASQSAGSSEPTNRTGVHNAPRSSSTNRMAHLRSSFTSQGISGEASELLLASWRSKTNQSYNSLCTKWITWCQSKNINPLDGPVADLVNFLAALHEQEYNYCSLNFYRSAISSIHIQIKWPLDWAAPPGCQGAERGLRLP